MDDDAFAGTCPTCGQSYLQAEIARLREQLRDAAAWCEQERANFGAVDGYDYRSGEEYGLRRAQIEIERRIMCAVITTV